MLSTTITPDHDPTASLELALEGAGEFGLKVGEARAHPRVPSRSYNNLLNSSTVSPASRTIPAIVNALTGFWRGMVRIRTPSVITMCLPCRTTSKPAFSRAPASRAEEYYGLRWAGQALDLARENARRGMEAIVRLEAITGRPGFPAR